MITEEAAMTTKHTATIVHESPSLLREWWMNENLEYDVVMGIIIIILNIVAMKYIIIYKIPFTAIGQFLFLSFSSAWFYIFAGQVLQSMDSSLPYSLFLGRIFHTMGFGCFLDCLYCISPHLALYMGLPCLLWFIVFMIGPCIYTIVQKLRDWWKFGRISQSASGVANSGGPRRRYYPVQNAKRKVRTDDLTI